jgi:hypothetical protein
MGWSSPATRVTGDLISASIYNTDIIGNLLALKSPPSAKYNIDEASDYTASSTSFTNVDNADLSLTITTTGGDVMVHFHGTVKTASSGATQNARIYFDLEVDGSREGGNDGICMAAGSDSAADGNTLRQVSFTRLITGLSSGSHTFKLQWKVSAATGTPTGTLYAAAGTASLDLHPQFWCREVS